LAGRMSDSDSQTFDEDSRASNNGTNDQVPTGLGDGNEPQPLEGGEDEREGTGDEGEEDDGHESANNGPQDLSEYWDNVMNFDNDSEGDVNAALDDGHKADPEEQQEEVEEVVEVREVGHKPEEQQEEVEQAVEEGEVETQQEVVDDEEREVKAPENLGCVCGVADCTGRDLSHRCSGCQQLRRCDDVYRKLKSGVFKKGTCAQCRGSDPHTGVISTTHEWTFGPAFDYADLELRPDLDGMPFYESAKDPQGNLLRVAHKVKFRCRTH
jgi:hypothetical protein